MLLVNSGKQIPTVKYGREKSHSTLIALGVDGFDTFLAIWDELFEYLPRFSSAITSSLLL